MAAALLAFASHSGNTHDAALLSALKASSEAEAAEAAEAARAAGDAAEAADAYGEVRRLRLPLLLLLHPPHRRRRRPLHVLLLHLASHPTEVVLLALTEGALPRGRALAHKAQLARILAAAGCAGTRTEEPPATTHPSPRAHHSAHRPYAMRSPPSQPAHGLPRGLGWTAARRQRRAWCTAWRSYAQHLRRRR